MQDAVEDRRGEHVVSEDLAPEAEGLIAGDEQRSTLVAAADELEDEIGAVATEGQISELVDNEQLGSAEPLQLLIEAILTLGLVELGDEPRGRKEQRRVARLDRLEPERDGEVRLAHARRSEQQHVFAGGDVTASRQLTHHPRIDRG